MWLLIPFIRHLRSLHKHQARPAPQPAAQGSLQFPPWTEKHTFPLLDALQENVKPFHQKGKESAFDHLSTGRRVEQSRLGKLVATLFPQLQ